MKASKCHAFLFLGLFTLAASPCFSADTLIFNNSGYSGYVLTLDPYLEMLDYGISPGGTVSKFNFMYSLSSTSTVWVRFYNETSRYEPGSLVKTFELHAVPGTGGLISTYEYVIPEQDRFLLAGGNFGYSFEFSNSSAIALASGGAGSDAYFWYDDEYYGMVPYQLNPPVSSYMRVYAIPEPATLMLVCGGALFLRKRK